MEGYCAGYTRASRAVEITAETEAEQRESLAALARERGLTVVPVYTKEETEGGCLALLEPYLDAVASEVISEMDERAQEESEYQDAVGRWFGEGGQ